MDKVMIEAVKERLKSKFVDAIVESMFEEIRELVVSDIAEKVGSVLKNGLPVPGMKVLSRGPSWRDRLAAQKGSPERPAERKVERKVSAVQRRHGQYLGLMAHAHPDVKAKARTILQEKGKAAAIDFLHEAKMARLKKTEKAASATARAAKKTAAKKAKKAKTAKKAMASKSAGKSASKASSAGKKQTAKKVARKV
jgi:hypothetical protein